MDYFIFIILVIFICSMQVSGFSTKRIVPTTRHQGRRSKFFIPRKILGGSSVRHDEMLYMLSMEVSGYFRCGASAITSEWAISAAHCLDDGEQPDDIILWSDSKERMTGKRHRIEKYVLHPNYERIVKNDISLLKVKDPFIIGKSLSFIELINANYDIRPNTELTSAGWGLTKSGESSDYLLKTTINYVTNFRCNEMHGYSHSGFILTDGMLCGFSEGRDTTQGDSGGPLVLKTGDGDILVGIVSFGSGEGKENGPGIYTRVSTYLDWINQVISVSPVTSDNNPNTFWTINAGGDDFWRNGNGNDVDAFSNWNQYFNWDTNGDILRNFLTNIQNQNKNQGRFQFY